MDEPAEHAAHAADAPFLQAVDVRQADVQALGQVLLLHVVQVHAFDDGLFLFGQPFQDVADLFQQQLAARGCDRSWRSSQSVSCNVTPRSSGSSRDTALTAPSRFR